jgi:hypothetical protein
MESQRAVPKDTAANFARDQGILFLETSAKSGVNVIEVFREIAQRLPKVKPDDKAGRVALGKSTGASGTSPSMCCGSS